METHPDSQTKSPRVMVYFDSWCKGGPGSVVNRLTQSLKARGCHVTWVLTEGSEDILPKDAAADEIITLPLPDNMSWFANKDDVLRAYHNVKPDIIITEQYPFVAYDEALHALLWTAKLSSPKPQIYSVARDVSRTDMNKHTLKIMVEEATQAYDHIYVRGDDNVVSAKDFLGHSERRLGPLKDKLSHRGYICSTSQEVLSSDKGKGEIVVSLGGGVFDDIDESMYELLVERAAELKKTGDVDSKWHFFVSNRYPQQHYDKLLKKAADMLQETGVNIQIDRNSPDYLEYVRNADMAVVRGGMSAVEAVALGKPTLIIPYNIFGRDTEQEIRANGLKKVAGDRVEVVPQYMNGHSVMKMFPVSRSTLDSAIRRLYPMRHAEAITSPVKVNGHEAIADDIMDRYMLKKAGINDNKIHGKHMAALQESDASQVATRR